MTRATVIVAALLISACSSPSLQQAPQQAPPPSGASFPGGDLIDLSHAYDDQTLFWPTAEPFHLEKVSDGVTPGGYYYAANNFSMAEHGGTHLDAPLHFGQGRQSIDEIPLDHLFGSVVVIDVTAAAEKNVDYQITADDFQQWERDHGEIPQGAIVLLRTGFSGRWPDAARYLGTAERGEPAVAKLHFPGLHPDGARWLIDNRSVKAVGIDTASIDYGQSKLFETHRALFDRNIPAFENLTSLERLPLTGAFIVALPIKIKGGSGGPLRAVGIVPRS